MSGRLFCFGLGYVARALARELRAEGWTVAGTTRDPSKRSSLDGVEILIDQAAINKKTVSNRPDGCDVRHVTVCRIERACKKITRGGG